jgi:hypothetical protein
VHGPRLKLTREHLATRCAFAVHFEAVKADYGNAAAVGLFDESGEEALLGNELAQHAAAVTDVLPYHAFDYDQSRKVRGDDTGVTEFVASLPEYGIFHRASHLIFMEGCRLGYVPLLCAI